MVSNYNRLGHIIEILKAMNCPELITDELYFWGFTVNRDDVRLANWNAWARGQLVESIASETLSVGEASMADAPSTKHTPGTTYFNGNKSE